MHARTFEVHSQLSSNFSKFKYLPMMDLLSKLLNSNIGLYRFTLDIERYFLLHSNIGFHRFTPDIEGCFY